MVLGQLQITIQFVLYSVHHGHTLYLLDMATM